MLGARGGLTGNEASRGGEKELQLQSEDLLGEKKKNPHWFSSHFVPCLMVEHIHSGVFTTVRIEMQIGRTGEGV